MSEPITRRSRHRLVGESNQDALARLAGERDAALRDNERRRAELPPAGLPPVLATVEDVGRVCEAAGLMTPAGATTETSRTWATADGGVQFRAWFEADSFYCVSPLHTFGLDMFRGTPSAVLWHAVQACLLAKSRAQHEKSLI